MGWADANGNPHEGMTGKAVRPSLCLFACEAVGGSVDDAMPGAIALELIHNFSLIHDEIQDCDEVRHNRPTLWATWGTPRALIAGNVLRLIADMTMEKLAEEGANPAKVGEATELVTEAYLEMIEGQYLDISFEGKLDVSLGAYLKMISLKTGALIRCALNLGAAIGAENSGTIAAFRDAGSSLGFAFQIRDDVLGVWGDQTTVGKPVGSDIRRKKNSLPMVYAMANATGHDKQILVNIYQEATVTEQDVDSILSVLDTVQAREYADKLVAIHCQHAIDALADFEMPLQFKQDFDELVSFIQLRQY